MPWQSLRQGTSQQYTGGIDIFLNLENSVFSCRICVIYSASPIGRMTVQEKKEEKTERAEKLDRGTETISVTEVAEPEISVKYVEAESELEAKTMMQKERPEDAYYLKFDVNI